MTPARSHPDGDGTIPPPVLSDDDVRAAKDALLQRGLLFSPTGHEALPDQIDRSWRRSISAGAQLGAGSVSYVNDYDPESTLLRAAGPVLDRLEAGLQDLGVAIFLADASGQIVARRMVAGDARRRFDAASAAVGFNFSEREIGTNGLGTPLHDGSVVLVRGPEHFNEALEGLSCAGAGIRHPQTRRVLGSVALAMPADATEAVTLALTREAGRQIEQRLAEGLGHSDVLLGQCYREHREKGPVVVMSRDTVMSNVTGLSFLSVESHARMWDSLNAQDWQRGPRLVDLDLPGVSGPVRAHRVDDAVGIFAVEILATPTSTPATLPTGPSTRPAGRASSTPATELSAPPRPTDVLHLEMDRAAASPTATVAVLGGSGAGKQHLVRSWLAGTGAQEPSVLEAGDLVAGWRPGAEETLRSGVPVLVRHVEDLPPSQLNALKALAGSSGTSSPGSGRLYLTADPERSDERTRGLIAQIATTIQVPPLALRQRDVPDLVQSLLAEVAPEQRPTFTAATLQVLLRWDWPGNVQELRRLVRELVAERPGAQVSPYHLPEQMWNAANRRNLTRLELAERNEIIAALRQAGGNRCEAAELLGIGRSSLYRRLKNLGVDDEAMRS